MSSDAAPIKVPDSGRTQHLHVVAGACSIQGARRERNEDHQYVSPDKDLFIVADGMGGHAAGEVASSIAVHEVRDAIHRNRDLIERFEQNDPEVQSVEILQMLEHAVQASCSSV